MKSEHKIQAAKKVRLRDEWRWADYLTDYEFFEMLESSELWFEALKFALKDFINEVLIALRLREKGK